MIWTRVKSAFIILLLVCNLVLFYVYKNQDFKREVLEEKDLVEKMETMLEKSDIDISEINDFSVDKLPSVKIEDVDLDFKKEKARFDSSKIPTYSEQEARGYLYSYTDNGILDVQYFGDELEYKLLSPEETIEIAKGYLPKPDAKIDFDYSNYYKLDDGSYDIYFEQCSDGIKILDGYIIMNIRGKKLYNLKEKVVRVSQDYRKTQDIIPYSLALYRLYSAVDEGDLPIKFVKVDIVEELGSNSEAAGIVSGEAFAYYRFISENNDRYLIKAIKEAEK